MNDKGQRWYRQPIAWLGILIFVGSMAGCIHLIVLASVYEDPPVAATDTDISFRIPATRAPSESPSAPAHEQP